MKKSVISIVLGLALLSPSCASSGELDWTRLISAGAKATQAMTLSDAQVRDYVHQYVADLDSKSRVLPSSNKYSQRLAQITSKFKSVDGVPLNFKVYQTDEWNAFACADGSVRVYTGIMDAMTDDELRGVIGHEIGHVAKHHSKKAFKSALLNSALRDGLASGDGLIATLSQSQLGDLGEALLSAKYSRKQETEADDYAYAFLKKAGYNPYALVLAFEKMQNMEQRSGAKSSAMTQLFSSHPDMSKRIANIKKKCAKDGYSK